MKRRSRDSAGGRTRRSRTRRPQPHPARSTLLAAHRDAAIEALDPDSLADVVMLRPVITLRPNVRRLDSTSAYSARYTVRPADNAYFMRDPMITTARGAVLGRLYLDVTPTRERHRPPCPPAARRRTDLPRLPARFPRGGDFIPCGSFVLQGQGLLTNAEGVQQLLTAARTARSRSGLCATRAHRWTRCIWTRTSACSGPTSARSATTGWKVSNRPSTSGSRTMARTRWSAAARSSSTCMLTAWR